MNIWNMIKPVLKQKGLTDEQIEHLEIETAKPRKIEDLPEWQQKLKTISTIHQKWQDKVKMLIDYAQKKESEKIVLEKMPNDPFEVYGYYFYLVGILKQLYPYRDNFEVITLLYKSLHTIIDNLDIIKESGIITEMEQIKARDFNNEVENVREKAENEVNKIKWDNFATNYSAIDFLYDKAIKEKKV